MSLQRILLTKEGFERISQELKSLKEVERPAIIEAIGVARDLGDLSENAEYHAARERQGLIEALIRKHESTLAQAEVIDPANVQHSAIRFGATITLYDKDRDCDLVYQLVGEEEADFDQGRISLTSPLGRALLGKEEGDDIHLSVRAKTRHLSILKVEYA